MTYTITEEIQVARRGIISPRDVTHLENEIQEVSIESIIDTSSEEVEYLINNTGSILFEFEYESDESEVTESSHDYCFTVCKQLLDVQSLTIDIFQILMANIWSITIMQSIALISILIESIQLTIDYFIMDEPLANRSHANKHGVIVHKIHFKLKFIDNLKDVFSREVVEEHLAEELYELFRQHQDNIIELTLNRVINNIRLNENFRIIQAVLGMLQLNT